MSQLQNIVCPKCKGTVSYSPVRAGKKGKCPTCGLIFTIPNLGASPPVASASRDAPTAADSLATIVKHSHLLLKELEYQRHLLEVQKHLLENISARTWWITTIVILAFLISLAVRVA